MQKHHLFVWFLKFSVSYHGGIALVFISHISAVQVSKSNFLLQAMCVRTQMRWEGVSNVRKKRENLQKHVWASQGKLHPAKRHRFAMLRKLRTMCRWADLRKYCRRPMNCAVRYWMQNVLNKQNPNVKNCVNLKVIVNKWFPKKFTEKKILPYFQEKIWPFKR